MEQESLNDVVQSAIAHFPAAIEVAGIKLSRQILAIDTEQHPLFETDACISYTRSTQEAEQLLWQLLEVLDHNLGAKYASSSRALYHNSRPWRVNKWREMLSAGLVYVVYRQQSSSAASTVRPAGRVLRRSDHATETPLLFLSFMLTEESGVCEDNDVGPDSRGDVWIVLYLYELQLLPLVRRHGLAARLVGEHLTTCCRALKRAFENGGQAGRRAASRVFGLELTVFSDNAPAIELYERRLGMQLAADSPSIHDTNSLYRLYILKV